MATERQKAVIAMLIEGVPMSEIVAKVTHGGDNAQEVETDDGTVISYSGKTGESSAKNLVRATRAVLNALAEMGTMKPIPKAERPKLSDEEKKERAAARREAKKAKREAEKAELEALRKELAEKNKA